MGQTVSGIECPGCLEVTTSLPRREMQLLVSKLLRLRPLNQEVSELRKYLPITDASYSAMLNLFRGAQADLRTVDVLELAMLLILLHWDSTAEDKVRVLLEIFDLNSDEQLSVGELSLLSGYLARSLSLLTGRAYNAAAIRETLTGTAGELPEEARFPTGRLVRRTLSEETSRNFLMALPGRKGAGTSGADRLRVGGDAGVRTISGGPVELCPVHMVDPRQSRECRLLTETEVLVMSRFMEVIQSKTAVLLDGKSRKLIWSEICRLVESCRSSLADTKKSDMALLTEIVARPISNFKTFITASRAEAIKVVTLRDLLKLVCPCASEAMIDGFLVFFIETVAFRPQTPSQLNLRPVRPLQSAQVGVMTLNDAVLSGLVDGNAARRAVEDGQVKSMETVLTKSVFVKIFVPPNLQTAAKLQWDKKVVATRQTETSGTKRHDAGWKPREVNVAITRAIDQVTANLTEINSGEEFASNLMDQFDKITTSLLKKEEKHVSEISNSATIDLVARRTGEHQTKSFMHNRELVKLQTELVKLDKEERQVSNAKKILHDRIQELERTLNLASAETQEAVTKVVADAPLGAHSGSRPSWLDRCAASEVAVVRALAEQLLSRFGDLSQAVLFIDSRNRGQVTCSDLAQACVILGLNEALVSDVFRILDQEGVGHLTTGVLFDRLVVVAGRSTTDVFDGRIPPPLLRHRTSPSSIGRAVSQPIRRVVISEPCPQYAQPRGFRAQSSRPAPKRQQPPSHSREEDEGTTAGTCTIAPGLVDAQLRIRRDRLRWESMRFRNTLSQFPDAEKGALRLVYSEFGTKVHRQKEPEKWSEFNELTNVVLARKSPSRRRPGEDIVYLKSSLAEVVKMQKTLLNAEEPVNLESGNFSRKMTRRDATMTGTFFEGIGTLGLVAATAEQEISDSEISDDGEVSEGGDEQRRERRMRQKLKMKKDDLLHRSRLFLKDTKISVRDNTSA